MPREHAEETVQPKRRDRKDPVREQQGYEQTESRVAFLGHPIHAMSVAFPIALTFCGLGADLFYWWSGEEFWARAAVWAVGTAFLFGMFSGFSGTAELLLVSGIRERAPAWTHFIVAVTLLAVLGVNWGQRLYGYEAGVLPYGILLSALSTILVTLTAWHGGKLVFSYRLGTSKGS